MIPRKLVCCKCSSPLSVLKIEKSRFQQETKWALGCQQCSLSPMISSLDFNLIIEKWMDPNIQTEYEEMYPGIKNITKKDLQEHRGKSHKLPRHMQDTECCDCTGMDKPDIKDIEISHVKW